MTLAAPPRAFAPTDRPRTRSLSPPSPHAERGRFTAEYKKLGTELTVLQDKVNAVQGSVFKGNEKMDQFKLQMNWNQEELEQWALAARQKEEDNLALLK